MKIPRVHNLLPKIFLVFLIFWGAASFFVFPALPSFAWIFLIVSLLAVYLALKEKSGYFILIDIIFSFSYFFYGLQSATGFPLWSIIICLAIILALAFWFLAQQFSPASENFALVLTFFAISLLELYLALSFWLINPLTKSLIMGIFGYVFTGYLVNISGKDQISRKFMTYVYTAVFVLAILVFTVSWGR
jgi:hypothetical protein